MSSEFEENFTSWQPPKGSGPEAAPLEPADRLWVIGKLIALFAAESANWLLHFGNYSLSNTVGADVFIADFLGIPSGSMFDGVRVSTIINSVLSLAAVATPVVLFGQIIERHEEIFGNPRSFFGNALNKIVTGLLLLVYAGVLVTECSALWLRVQAESAPSPIPALSGHATGFWPMLIMTGTLVLVNLAMGLATAHMLRSAKRALGRSAS